MKRRGIFAPFLWGALAAALLLFARYAGPATEAFLDIAQRATLAHSISDTFLNLKKNADPLPDIITGTIGKKESAPEAGATPAATPQSSDLEKVAETKETDKPAKTGKGEPTDIEIPEIESGEKILLRRLSERRAELEDRERLVNEREALISAAEKKLEQRIADLKSAEAEMKAELDARKTVEATVKPVIIMYESMKPKDAARIFEKLDVKDVLPIAQAMNPRKLSDILAQLDPATAGKITVGLAPRSKTGPVAEGASPFPELPDVSAPVR